jgi:hypothetical protein
MNPDEQHDRIEPMDGDAYTQAEARNWHENAKQWQRHAEELESDHAVLWRDADRHCSALDQIGVILRFHSAEPWAMLAIATLVGRAFDPLGGESLRWEDAMQFAIVATREPRNV